MKVLYIAGTGRNGSTILANALGEAPGFCSVGEVRYLWDRGILENRHCGCGEPFAACTFWTEVLDAAFSGADREQAERMSRLRRLGPHPRHFAVPGRVRRIVGSDEFGELSAITARLYEGIRSVGGCRVIVDASKFPSYRHVLDSSPEVDVYTVHLVRDPRAFAYSWWYRKRPASSAGKEQWRAEPMHPVRTSAWWVQWNALLRRTAGRRPDRYRVVRYEDFVRDPQGVLDGIFRLLGEEPARLTFGADASLELGTHHTVSGNPSRFRTGRVTLRSDEEWRVKMGRRDRLLVGALTWVEARHYGYLLTA